MENENNNMRKPISLRYVLFICFTLVSIVPILFLSFGVQKAAFELELKAVEEKHLIIAKNLTGSLERYLVDIESALKTFARNSYNRNPSAEVVDLMFDLKFRNIWKLNRDGTSQPIIHNKAFAEDDPLPIDVMHQVFQTVPANQEKMSVSGIMNDSHGDPVFFVSKLIDNDAILVGSVAIDYIREVQENISFGNLGHAAVVDQHGKIMAHPHREWVETSKDVSFLPPVKGMKEGQTGVTQFFTPAMNADMIAGYAVVKDVGWGVMIPQPISELEELADYANYIAVMVAFLGIAIASILSWWLSSYIIRPIQSVVDFTETIARGDISKRMPSDSLFSPLETHRLKNSFNRMIERLRLKTNELIITTERLRHAQNIARLGNWELDIKSGNMWWSDEVFQILNVQKKDNPFPCIDDFTGSLSERDKEQFLNQITLISVNKKPFSIDHKIHINRSKEISVHQDVIVQEQDSGRVLCITGTIQDISERKKYENRLFYQAHYDALTRLPNRQLCLQKLRSEVGKSESGESVVTLLVLGLDHFKEINESLGHFAGDQILAMAARRIEEAAGKDSIVARVGSDEFAIILTNSKEKEVVAKRCEALIACLNDSFVVNDIETLIGGSIGVSRFPRDGHEPLTLLQKASSALHKVKTSGSRGTYTEFTTDMNEQVMRRLNLRSDLAQAIDNSELRLEYQPIVESMTGRVIAAEALIRWEHPSRGNVAPEDFIPLAEQTGYIRDIGVWALQTACKEIRSWRDNGIKDTKMSINLSPSQIQYGLNKETIVATLEQFQLKPSDLCFEITESLIIDDLENSLRWMNELKDIGVSFAIDDFGTGYSSLSYLVNLPVSSVKIDGSFVSNMLYGEKDATLIESIITLSKKLGLTVVAEGVETIDQRKTLVRYGCDHLQGHFFSKPLRSLDFTKYMELTTVKEALLKRL